MHDRRDTGFENMLRFTFYLPLCLTWLFIMGLTLLVAVFKGIRLILRESEPTEAEIEKMDSKSLNVVTLATLSKLNKERGDNKLPFGQFMFAYFLLNFRTEFEADDVFSQKTAIWVHIFKLKSNKENFEDGAINHEQEDDENYQRMTQRSKQEIKKANNFKRIMQMLCILSLFTSSLALGSIFGELYNGTRKIILCSLENAILRICFGLIILFIAQRDIFQILINLSVRYTGAMSHPKNSRFIFLESLLRICITFLALLTIIFTIFSTSSGDIEGIID